MRNHEDANSDFLRRVAFCPGAIHPSVFQVVFLLFAFRLFSPVRLLDQYILRNFLMPFVYSCLGFIAIWLVFELGSKANDFISGGASLGYVFLFQLGQLPSVAVLILPIALLLALLYCLGRMSQSNEILSMLSAGVSLSRVLLPIFIMGLAVTALSTYLNYAPAPQADARRERAEAELEAGRRLQRLNTTVGYLFPNRTDNRVWFIEKLPSDTSLPLGGVRVEQITPQGITKYYAKTATYDEPTRTWLFHDALVVHTNPDGSGTLPDGNFDKTRPPLVTLTGWSETPWRIASAVLQPDKLSVPELRQYLQLNGDFTNVQLAPFRAYLAQRWADPWVCMVVVCFASALGVVYNRRSVLVGVATAIILFALIFFFGSLFLALGKGARMPAFWAVWTTNIVFGTVGLLLLRQRALNRDKLFS